MEIIKLKKTDSTFERDFSFLWRLYNCTIGALLSDYIERKTLVKIYELLENEASKALPNKDELLKNARRNFGNNRFTSIFNLITPLNKYSAVMRKFCQEVCTAGALDIAYNIHGKFSLNGCPTYPRENTPDLIAQVLLDFPSAQGVRNRYQIVRDILSKSETGGDILSIACGSAQAVIHGAKDLINNGTNVNLILTDSSEYALDLSRCRAKEAGIIKSVEFHKIPFWKLKREFPNLKTIFTEGCGIADYLKDNHVVALAEYALSTLQDSGHLVMSGMNQTPHAKMLSKPYNWDIEYRPPKKFGELMQKAGGKNIKIYVEPWEIYYVATATN